MKGLKLKDIKGFPKDELALMIEDFECREANEIHSGDCTNECHTCMKCLWQKHIKALKEIGEKSLVLSEEKIDKAIDHIWVNILNELWAKWSMGMSTKDILTKDMRYTIAKALCLAFANGELMEEDYGRN